jgi:hypothetical protein
VNLGNVPVGDADDRPRVGPGGFRRERKIAALDLRDEVFAHRAAGALGVRLRSGQRDFSSLDHVAWIPLPVPLLDQAREVKPAERCGLVVAGPLDEAAQGLFLAVEKIGRFARGHNRAACPLDPVEVGGKKGRPVGIALVEGEEVAIQADGVEQRRIGVGDLLGGLRLPREEFLGRAEGGRVGVDLERVLRGHEPALAGT